MKTDKKYIMILVLFLMAATVSWSLYFKEYRQGDTVNILNFPMQIGPWTGEDMRVTEDEYAILETRNVVARKYVTPDKQRIYLFIVYSQNNRKVSHPPEVCYTGSGVSILDNAHDTVNVDFPKPGSVIRANRLLLDLNGAQQVSFYWFKVGDAFTSNYWKQQSLIAVKTLLGRPASSALIRVSSDVVGGDKEKAISLIKDFTQLSVGHLFEYLP